MSMSEKMQAMVNFVKKHQTELDKNGTYKSYVAPNIPDKVAKKLIKNFDNHLPANSIVAYFDTTVFSNMSRGYLFTTDGFYYKYFSTASYFQYANIDNVSSYGTLFLNVNVKGSRMVDISDVLDTTILQTVLEELMRINKQFGYSTNKSTGKVKKVDLPKDIEDKCHAIIHTASVACGSVGTGLAQIPLSDNAVIVPAQIAMIISLGAVFELNITESAAKGILASASATIAGRSVTQVLWGWIPIVGNAINTATAAGITEIIGWMAVKNFYERWIEDKNKGRFEGMKDGYTEASYEYERKLRKQAEDFLKQIKDVERERAEYEKLLNDYEMYIQELEEKCASQAMIVEMKDILRDLKALG